MEQIRYRLKVVKEEVGLDIEGYGRGLFSATREQTREMGRGGVFDVQQVGAATVLCGTT